MVKQRYKKDELALNKQAPNWSKCDHFMFNHYPFRERRNGLPPIEGNTPWAMSNY